MEDKDGLIPWRVGFLRIPLYKKQVAEDEDRDPNKPVKKELTPLEAFTQKAREKLKYFLQKKIIFWIFFFFFLNFQNVILWKLRILKYYLPMEKKNYY